MTDKTAPEQEAPRYTLDDFFREAKEKNLTVADLFPAVVKRLAEMGDPDAVRAEQEAPLTDEQILAAALRVDAGLKRIRDRAALAPQPKGTRPLTDQLIAASGMADGTFTDGVRYAEGWHGVLLSAPRPLVAEPPAFYQWANEWEDQHGNVWIRKPASLSPAPSITPEPVAYISDAWWSALRRGKLAGMSLLPFEGSRPLYAPAPDASSTVAPADARESLVHPISTSSAPSSSGGPSGLA